MADITDSSSEREQESGNRIEPRLRGGGPADVHELAIDLLRRERDFITAVLDTAGALVVVLDRQGRLVHINRYSEQVTGYTCDEVRGQPFWDKFIVPEELAAVRNAFQEIQSGRFPSQHENVWLTRDGSRRHITWSNTALLDTAGAVEFIIATGIDVTEQRQAEAARRESEALNRSIIEGSRDCIKLLDVDGRLKFMSEGGRHLLGIKDMACYLNVPYDSFWEGSDRQATLEALASARSGEMGRFRGYCPTEDGIPKWWDVVISPILDAEGKVEQLLAVSRDVTEQREAEEALRESREKLKALFDLLPIGLSILDEERHIVQDNAALYRILGLSKRDLETGTYTSRTYLRSDGTPMPSKEFPTVRAFTEQKAARDQVGVVTESGAVIWTDVSAAPVPFSDWKVVAATTDITELKTAQEGMRQMNDELEQRVAERTLRLVESNLHLEREIRERRKVEEELRRSEEVLEQRVEERTRDLATLLEISNAVALSKELEPLLRQTLELLAAVVQHDGATVYRLEDDTLHALLHRGPLPEEEVRQLSMPVERPSLAHELLATQKPISIPDIWADTPPARALREVSGERLDSLFGYIRSWLGLPLTVKGRVVGLLTLQRSEPLAFDEREVKLAQAFAGQLAVAVENARLHEQAQQLAAMEERQRLARELHDAVSQTLFSASLAAEVLPRLWEKDPEMGLQCLGEVRQLTRGALAEMRTLLLELRPAALVQTELAALLQQLAEAASSRARIAVAVHAEPHCPLPEAVQLALYRIVQEALNNIAKHAGAHQAVITLRCGAASPGAGARQPVTEVWVSITDDGRGFDLALIEQGASGIGLSIMRERAVAVGATLHVASTVGKGTQITAVWPANGHLESVTPR